MSLKILFLYGLLLGALALSGCATDSGTLTWNPFRNSGSGGGSSCGPGCSH
jgi:hypothetical protein